MASTYTTNIRLEKQADGENPNSWGDILNQNVIDLVDQAVAGYQIVSVSGTTPITLTELDGTTDQSRNAALSFDGTLTAETSIIIPSNDKTYFVRNNTSGSFALKIKTLGNTASVLEQGQNIMIATDGTNIYQSSFPTSVSAFTVNSLTATSVSTSVLNATEVSTSILSATQINATSVSAVSGRFSGTVSASAFDGLGNNLIYGGDAQGDILYNNGTNIQNLAAGTSGQFLQTKGSSANPVFSFPNGDYPIQQITTSSSNQTNLGSFSSIVFPSDGTVPQNTEGVEVTALQTTITPTNASNFLIVEGDIFLEASNSNLALAALFVDSSTDAIALSQINNAIPQGPTLYSFRAKVTAAGTSQRIFKVRIGTPTAGSSSNTCQFNNNDSNFGGAGAYSSRIVVKEVPA